MRFSVPINFLIHGQDQYSNGKFLFTEEQLVIEDLAHILLIDNSKLCPLKVKVDVDRLRVIGNNAFLKLGRFIELERLDVDIVDEEISEFKEIEFDLKPVHKQRFKISFYAVFICKHKRSVELKTSLDKYLQGKVFKSHYWANIETRSEYNKICIGIRFEPSYYDLLGYDDTRSVVKNFFTSLSCEKFVLSSIDGIKPRYFFIAKY